MGNYWSNDNACQNDARLSALESRILYLEAQRGKPDFTTTPGDGFEQIDHPQNKVERSRPPLPTFHNELRKRLKIRRKYLEVPMYDA